ncbi:hypothetical protein HU200_039304 [Digitaria exilis]|uniref:Uncharacterized protein n=1 Tax=Digitaria exilis TaxID=1010633 RepID=A0A835EJR7_9POAL|nr:hypothetical protein HU200_039304 [Digitaria exilis]
MAAVVAAVEAGVVAVASGRGCCSSSNRLVRGLYWRLRAVLRRLRSERASRRGGRARFSYHYDALSYALNFDDGRAAAAAAADLVVVPSDALR